MPAVAERQACELRLSSPADEPFLLDVCRCAHEDLSRFTSCSTAERAAIDRIVFELEAQTVGAIYPGATTSVVTIGGEGAGRLVVERTATAMHLVDITLLPQFRCRGIGTHLVASLCKEAAALHVPLRLRVAVDNDRALSLYERLGFDACGADGLFIEMEWRAG